MYRGSVWTVCLAALLLLPGADAPGAPGYRTRMRLQMGSLTEITVPDAMYAPESVSRAFDVIERLDALLSTYKPESEVMRLSREGTLRVSAELFELAERSIDWSQRTGNAFDPVLGPVIALWREAGQEQRLPSPDALDEARRRADVNAVRLDARAGTITFAQPGMGFDFGGIGKGYAVDQAAASLQRDRVTVALVASGGSSHRLLGLPRGGCWELGLRHPEDAERSLAFLRTGPGGISSSSQSGQPIEIEGKRFGHILDPRTGRPAEPLDPVWSVTVLGPDATGPDALSTAIVVLGAARGLALTERIPGYEAILMVRTAGGAHEFHWTRGLIRGGTLEGLPLFVPRDLPVCLEGGTGMERHAGQHPYLRPALGHGAQSKGRSHERKPA